MLNGAEQRFFRKSELNMIKISEIFLFKVCLFFGYLTEDTEETF